ncbi:mechanosensitive ion channel family protein [Panacagrimonas sp.]|uniref:mechanosensitive ion channel family protein n=1 Tax=Panacagrimonas sp. TaxID=2480088 RepID=UPI003B5180E7
MEFLEQTIVLGNPLSAWLTALAIALSINVVVGVIKWQVVRRFAALAENSATPLDDAIVAVAQRTRQTLILLVTLFIGSHYLDIPARLENMFMYAAVISGFVQLGLWMGAGLEFWLGRYRKRSMESNPGAATAVAAMGFVGRLVLWAIVLLLMLDNLGVDVTAMVAGLGVGGIAVALAVQNILGDLFASLSIIVDKPFVIGDFVVVDDFAGTIEHVGLKTTRIRSLSGEQLVFSNSDLLGARVRNYKRMYERRIVFKFGVLYQTTADQLEQIPHMVKQIVDAQENARFDRAHFFGFGDSSLDYEVVFWMKTPDYGIYMNTQQAINLALVRRFAQDKIEFAYPTRTLFIEGGITPLSVSATTNAAPGNPTEAPLTAPQRTTTPPVA